jgi:hypothetical protein
VTGHREGARAPQQETRVKCYVCPTCLRAYDNMEVMQHSEPGATEFRCADCDVRLEYDPGAQQSATALGERVNRQLGPFKDALRALHHVVLLPYARLGRGRALPPSLSSCCRLLTQGVGRDRRAPPAAIDGVGSAAASAAGRGGTTARGGSAAGKRGGDSGSQSMRATAAPRELAVSIQTTDTAAAAGPAPPYVPPTHPTPPSQPLRRLVPVKF